MSYLHKYTYPRQSHFLSIFFFLSLFQCSSGFWSPAHTGRPRLPCCTTSFYLHGVPEVCNAIVLQEAFLIDSKSLKDFPCLSNLEAAKLITSSGVALYMHVCLVASVISDSFETPWTVAYQVPLSMGFCRQEYWSGLSFPPSRGSSQGLNPCFLCLLHWQVDSLTLYHLGSPRIGILNQ